MLPENETSEAERSVEWLRHVRDVCRLMAQESDPGRLFPQILDHAIAITRADRGFLVIVQERLESGYHFDVREARGFDQDSLSSDRGKVSRTIVRQVMESGQGLVSSQDRSLEPADITSLRNQNVLSVICVPMTLRGEVRGVIYLDSRSKRSAFTDGDLPILSTFADQAALALESAESAGSEEEGLEGSGGGAVFAGLIGESEEMLRIFDEIRRVGRSWETVLVRGESGTGKELVARSIHRASSRSAAPFFALNCAAVSETLIESELFGYARGAFSGAERARAGLFVHAGRGTLFLDEVGDMPLSMQAKLLRVIQERRVRPVGATETVAVNCRLIAATHQNLEALVEQGRFRPDLFYRLDVLRVASAALRDHATDIPLLCEHFATRYGGPRGLRFTPRALELLSGWSWPGNVRELENEIRRLAALGVREVTALTLSSNIREGRGLSRSSLDLSGLTLGEIEKAAVENALRNCSGEKTRAARSLGIARTKLYRLIERHGIKAQ